MRRPTMIPRADCPGCPHIYKCYEGKIKSPCPCGLEMRDGKALVVVQPKEGKEGKEGKE